MTIYVDEPIFPYRGEKYCHLFTDGELFELHSFIIKIGMKMEWFQNPDANPRISWPHYDCGPKFRAKAVKDGGVEVDRYFAAELSIKRRGYWTKEEEERFKRFRALKAKS